MSKLFFLCILFWISTNLIATPIKVLHNKEEKIVNQASLDKIKPFTINVTDPIASTNKKKVNVKYVAYDGRAIFDLAFGNRDAWIKSKNIIIECADGYKPVLPISDFVNGEFYFAISRADGKDFSLNNQSKGGKLEKLAPYYIVWTRKSIQAANKGHYWPYQVVGLQLN